MRVIEVNLSEPSIKKALAERAITELRDPRYPLRLRINKARTHGSWYLVHYVGGKAHWYKLGRWPDLKAKRVIDSVPALLLRLAPINSVNPINSTNSINQVNLDEWELTGDLLAWYRARALSDRSLSDKRKRNIKSAVDKHLVPALAEVPLTELDHARIDESLIWPLQNRYQVATVRQYFAILKRGFKQAHKLKYLNHDPLAGLSFTDFIDTKITAAAAKLAPKDLPALLQTIGQAKPFHQVFIYLMLALGTRIGETRQLTWSMIDHANHRLVIPAAIIKTGKQRPQDHVLPLTDHLFEVLTLHKLNQGLWGYRGDYLFSSPSKRGPIDETMANDWVKSVSDGAWTAHHLRKLARTCWAELGIDYMVAEQLLNHAMTKLDQAYIHTYVETQKRQAITDYHRYLNQLYNPFDSKTITRSVSQLKHAIATNAVA